MCLGLSPAPAFGTATSRLLLPCSLSFRDEYDGGGLGDEAGAARCHRRQLARNAGPDRLPGALMVASAAEDSRPRFLPRQRGTAQFLAAETSCLCPSSFTEKEFDNDVLREEEKKRLFFFFGRTQDFIQDMGL